jgi:hypothetical protein
MQGEYIRRKKVSLIIIGLSGLLLSFTTSFSAIAASQAAVALAWNPSASSNVVGYNVYYGGVSGIYTNEISAGSMTNLTISGLATNTTYYFVATAVNNSGIQSTYSSPASYYTVSNISGVPILRTPAYSGNVFSFLVSGITGSNCVIQVSTNLVKWTSLQTNTIPFQFTDSKANQYTKRFYRALYH